VREKPRLVDSGLFAHVRHPIYTQVSYSPFAEIAPLTTPIYSGNLIVGASLALAFWSYIPLYTLPIAIGGYLLKVPIEVCD
jgi:protein-S-isoprenylcysteine O-methyltransferase Ste14